MGQRHNPGDGRLTLRRRDLIALFGGTMLAWPPAVRGQEPGRTTASAPCPPCRVRRFITRFMTSCAGSVSSRVKISKPRQGYGLRPKHFWHHAAELAKTKVDVIVCVGAAAIRAAQQATATIPILGITDDMVGEGFVRSMAHPGGNTTGSASSPPNSTVSGRNS